MNLPLPLPDGVALVLAVNHQNYALVDEDDYPRVSEHSWYAVNDYMYAMINRQRVYLHQFIINAPLKTSLVDHINRDKRDNRKSNLRLADKSINAQNSKTRTDNNTGYKGVHWSKCRNKFIAQICLNGQGTHLGCFTTARDAAIAYNQAARMHFGPNAKLNDV